MNRIEIKDEKFIVIREYYNGNGKPNDQNDILEYLYEIRDLIKEKLDGVKKNPNVAITSSYSRERFKHVDHPNNTYHSINVSYKNYDKINDMIDHVIDSNDNMFCVVWDRHGFWLDNPRFGSVEKNVSEVPVLNFTKDKLFYIDKCKANVVIIRDSNTYLEIYDDKSRTVPIRNIGDLYTIFDLLRDKEYSYEKIKDVTKRTYLMNYEGAEVDIKDVNETMYNCADCGKYYRITDYEKNWYKLKNFTLPSRRCRACREKKKFKKLQNMM